MTPTKHLPSSSSSSDGSSSINVPKKRRVSSKGSTTMNDDKNYEAVMRRIDSLEEVIKNSFSRLTEEVMTLRREVTRKRKVEGTAVQKVLPSEPIKSGENLLELEEKLRDADAFNTLVQDFLYLTGGTQADFVRNCWRSVIEDEAAQHFTWFGSKDKKAAKELIVAAAVKAAFQKKHPNDPLETMEERSNKYFQYAKDRVTKKMKYNEKSAPK